MDFESHPEEWLRVDHLPSRGAPGLFLDRDGTVIENVPYLNDPELVRVFEGTRESIAAFRAQGYAIVVITNQSAIARNLCSPQQYRAVESRIQGELGPCAADATFACPFHPDGVGSYAIRHSSRKPAPGMILDAAKRFGLDLASSVLVGDSLCDIEAGVSAGVGRLVHVLTGHGRAHRQAVQEFAQRTKVDVETFESLGSVRPLIRNGSEQLVEGSRVC